MMFIDTPSPFAPDTEWIEHLRALVTIPEPSAEVRQYIREAKATLRARGIDPDKVVAISDR
jgi:hypothetical protein